MALELRLSTDKAVKALQRFDQALVKTQQGMANFNKSIAGMNTAMAGLSKSTATGAVGLQRVNTAATNTSKGFRTAARGATNVNKNLKTLHSTAGTVRSALAGLGVALGGLGIARAVKSTFDAVNAFHQLEGQMKVATHSAQGGARAIKFVRDVARQTGTSVLTLAKSYKTFAVNALAAGKPIQEIEFQFRSIAIAGRALGLTTEQTKRTYIGFQQVITKNQFMMEELNNQIGENIVVLPLLAKAVGVSTKRLREMLSQGEIGLKYLGPLAQQLRQVYGVGLAEAMKSPLAMMNLIGNAITDLQVTFGKPLFDAIAPSLLRLAAALVNFENNNKAAIKSWAEWTGGQVSAGIDAITFMADNFSTLAPYIMAVTTAISALIALRIVAFLAAWTQTSVLLAASIIKTTAALLPNTAAMLANAAAAIANGTALRALGAASMASLTAMASMLLIVTALAAAYGVWMIATGQSQTLLSQVGDLIKWIGVQMGYTSGEMEVIIEEWKRWAQTLYNDVTGAIQYVIDSINGFWDNLNDFKTWLQSWGPWFEKMWNDAWEGAADTIKSVGSTIQGYISSIMSAISSFIRKVKQALGLAKQAKAAASDSGGGTAPGARAGGISHKLKGGMRYHTGPNTFVGAPHFADGGVTGIPAILHPNEAVIPLKGGKVPVDLGGLDGGMRATDPRAARLAQNMVDDTSTTAKGIEKMVDLMADLDDKMQRVVQVVGGKLDKVANTVNQVMTKINSMGTGGGSAGSGFSGGGGGGFGGSGGGGGGSLAIGKKGTGGGGTIDIGGTKVKESHPFYEEITGMKRKLTTDIVQEGPLAGLPKDLAKWIIESSAAGDGRLTAFMNGSPWKVVKEMMWPGAMIPAFYTTGQEIQYRTYKAAEAMYNSGDLGTWANFLRTGHIPTRYKAEAGFGMIGQTAQSMMGKAGTIHTADNMAMAYGGGAGTGHSSAFAKGTPNTSMEKLARAGSGRLAVVHGNEAIIPLTGGRKVPVQLPKRAVDAMQGSSSGGQGSNNGGITINMNVSAKDVDSFRRSKRQMVQELSREIKSVEREIGKPADSDLTRTKNTTTSKAV